MVTFNYGSLSAYKSLATKDPDALYVLDNHQLYKGELLISSVRTVVKDSDLPVVPTDDMRECYFISLESGKIKYVTYDKQYVDVSQLMIEEIVLSNAFIQKLITEINKSSDEITMPTMEVNDTTLIWTASNVNSFKAFKID